MKKTRILLVDDHSLMRIGLTTLLSVQKDMSVVGEAEDGEEAVRLARATEPDVIIMDLMMPGMSGAEATRRIIDESPQSRILILTSYGTSADLIRAVSHGASGVVTKGCSTADLVKAIRTVASGEKVIPAEIAQELAQSSIPLELTPRQQQILMAVSQGFNSEEIARQCGITVSCVKWHIKLACDALRATTRAEAAAIAIKKHLLKI